MNSNLLIHSYIYTLRLKLYLFSLNLTAHVWFGFRENSKNICIV